ncbi:MAG: 3-deoxy-7-phosphoheptulonate synthase [Planctomycetes bacterium]|nr:3-deoxy-7-phosphoheptulonate synthase [Planctomycetota bacterium]
MSSPHRKPAYKLVARSRRPALGNRTLVVDVAGVKFGAGTPVVVAGPCSVESRRQTLAAARAAKDAGADMLRGGVFKTRTSPYDFQGLGEKGLDLLAEAREVTGLPFVTEAIDPRHVRAVARVADMVQVGTRNMHNTALLKEVGRAGKPVLLKRGWASTLDEWLCAAEYVALEGDGAIVLCERGIRTDPSGRHAFPAIDFGILSELRRATFLPVLIDPSHGTEDARRVPAACSTALAAGADGLLIEILPAGWAAKDVRCDGHQSVSSAVLAKIVKRAKAAARP